MEIIWKDIPEYEGLYKISSQGVIMSYPKRLVDNMNGGFKLRKARIMRQSMAGRYMRVTLYDSNKVKMGRTVHRIVAKCFIENPDNLPEVNHIDADRTNNGVKNLEWCTRSYNTLHAYKLGNLKPRYRPVVQYSLLGKYIKEFKSVLEAAKETGNHRCNIIGAAKGRHQMCGGFIWKYKNITP